MRHKYNPFLIWKDYYSSLTTTWRREENSWKVGSSLSVRSRKKSKQVSRRVLHKNCRWSGFFLQLSFCFVFGLNHSLDVNPTKVRSRKPDVYLQSCLWVIHLYHTKQCIDWSLFYPFACAPTVDQLQKWLKAKIASGITSLSFNDFQYVTDLKEEEEETLGFRKVKAAPEDKGTFSNHDRFARPLLPLEVLAATLPPHAAKLLPKPARKPFREIFDETYYEYVPSLKTYFFLIFSESHLDMAWTT